MSFPRLFGRRPSPRSIASAPRAGDALQPSSPFDCTPEEVERWNAEWLAYLGREWQQQLTPHTAYPGSTPLPATAREMLDLRVGGAWPLALYCDPEALAGRRVMEMGCGCGNLGKLVARYVESYLGTDYSTLALAVARLVSPPHCAYLHVGDRAALEPRFGTIETVIGRYFWIHQNRRLAGLDLDFLARFLVPGGRIYADFYWPDPAVEQGVVLDPDRPLSHTFPSATFPYTLEDVERTLAGRPFRIEREEVSVQMQRRYVVLERT
jgi:SAM-dependent methyltransferase